MKQSKGERGIANIENRRVMITVAAPALFTMYKAVRIAVKMACIVRKLRYTLRHLLDPGYALVSITKTLLDCVKARGVPGRSTRKDADVDTNLPSTTVQVSTSYFGDFPRTP
ncbi:hypothetical protein E1B28_007881 [Marasmius oreades]|uniref:Uncharacterized protein n=1 Tax=Marasmius oreades TaxID=181124 RepID=A0A9P7UTX6_9AGAR|nr:uncharacterized protein E1B28_007881 [Marasmius oreades]KAG7094277.1 hypothetical protein E1B28_007881 [Marasmius oreades]